MSSARNANRGNIEFEDNDDLLDQIMKQEQIE